MSEVSELASEATSERSNLDSEASSELSSEWSEWLPKGRLAALLEVSEKTIETRVKSSEYQGQLRKGRAFVRIRIQSEDFRKLPPNYAEETPNKKPYASEPSVVVPSVSEAPPTSTPRASEQSSEVTSEITRQLKEAHAEAIKAKNETIAELKAQIAELKEDKNRMTRQIEAGNTAMVTMREAKKMREEAEQIKSSGWLSWFKR